MITYSIGVLLLVQWLQDTHLCIIHTWYADDAEAGGSFGYILAQFNDIQIRGAPQGYFPEPTKSILVAAPQNVARAE